MLGTEVPMRAKAGRLGKAKGGSQHSCRQMKQTLKLADFEFELIWPLLKINGSNPKLEAIK